MNNAYAAGLMDGEGSITLPKYKKTIYRYPSVTLASTTFDLVRFMQETYGGCIATKKAKQKSHHKQAYQWSVVRSEAISFLEKVLPYMKEPEKIRRGKLIVSEYLTLTPRNGKYTQEIEKRKLDFQDRFFSTSTHVNV